MFVGVRSTQNFHHWERSEARGEGGILSPLLCNVFMDNLSLQLHRQSIGGSVCGTVVNHMKM